MPAEEKALETRSRFITETGEVRVNPAENPCADSARIYFF
jgi:hypothetical protein